MSEKTLRSVDPVDIAATSHARDWRPGYVIKLVLMALINAFGVYMIWAAYLQASWGIVAGVAVILIAVDWVYFAKRTLPLKYILPGLAFLLVFQLGSMLYTGYVAFTNYSTGHNTTMDQAVDAILIQNERRTEDSPTYPLVVVRDEDDTLGFAILDGETVRVGTAEEPLADAPDATADGTQITAVPGWQLVPRTDVLTDPALQEDVLALRVPVSDDAEDGSIRTREGSTGAIYTSALEWDPDARTMTDTTTGVVYSADDSQGLFVAPDGSTLTVGWRVNVGFDNFTRAFTEADYSTAFVRIVAWTFSFAALTVASSFLVGIAIAIVFNDRRLRGQKAMRTLFVLPYAFPAFLSALLWRGMLNPNPDYGLINDWFFLDAYIRWLTDPTLAKVSILLVNLWLSFPYWFVICTGALQSLPDDVMEAAKIDGASGWRTWRAITLPLLLVSTAPLLIASFAFNFNNFSLIFMLTGGGPRFTDTSAALGHTDILISMIYQISGAAGGRSDYGLASALSILVFIVVGTISALAFRRTRKLEEIL